MLEMLKRAKEDKTICEKLEPFLPDEFAARGCGYHIQQAIEKEMKSYLLLNGIEYPKTHNVQKLLNIISDSKLPLPNELSERIEDMSDTLFNWETNNRYDPYSSFTERKYKRAVDIYTCLESYILNLTASQSAADEKNNDVILNKENNIDITSDDEILNFPTRSR